MTTRTLSFIEPTQTFFQDPYHTQVYYLFLSVFNICLKIGVQISFCRYLQYFQNLSAYVLPKSFFRVIHNAFVMVTPNLHILKVQTTSSSEYGAYFFNQILIFTDYSNMFSLQFDLSYQVSFLIRYSFFLLVHQKYHAIQDQNT